MKLCSLLAALALSGCATLPPAEPAKTRLVAAPAASAHDELFALLERSSSEYLDLHPMDAIDQGDIRQPDRLTYALTDEYYTRMRSLREEVLQALSQIPYRELSATDRIAYDAFRYENVTALAKLSPQRLEVTRVRPFNHFWGLQNYYPSWAGVDGPAPFKTVEDYESALARHADYASYLERAIASFRQGMASGVVETRMTVENMVTQLDQQLAIPTEESTYYSPIAAMPDSFTAAEKERLAKATRSMISETVYPAVTRLRDFLRDEYLPVARESVGLSQMKGGSDLYAALIEENTTLPLGADDVHRTGLAEVARILAETDKVQKEIGFTGTRNEFFEYMRTDPKFASKSREGIGEMYRAIGKEVAEHLLDYFYELPRTPLEVRPYEEFREQFEAGASYRPGSPDGSRPAIFFYNAYDLPSRRTTSMSSTYLHEAEPGHHFETSFSYENDELPEFLRFNFLSAFSEGWALYAESLGYPMGLYDDPVRHFGALQDEQMRAMRLVVDTGIHAMGWSREQAIDYMLANSGMSRTDVVAEVERYIAIPGQALSYKIGALKILELRSRAEAALGDNFDIREFHDQVLGTGIIPLPILEQKIDRWIASKRSVN